MTLSQSTAQLQSAGIDSARLDAQLLLAHVMGATREDILLSPPTLTPEQAAQYAALIARRASREPLSHLIGKREFYGREFIVTKDTLDPRPDSETLIETALRVTSHELASSKPPAKTGSRITILDIGTGTGCLLLTLLAELPHAIGIGVDISEQALAVAKQNAEKLGVSTRATLLKGDLAALHDAINGKVFDLIVSNPPYIPTAEIPSLMPEVAEFEPKLALDGGKDGLDCYRKLAKQAAGLLAPHGAMVLEFGSTQADDIADIMRENGLHVEAIVQDLAGHPRCMVIRRNPHER